jgi:hypothetical protein
MLQHRCKTRGDDKLIMNDKDTALFARFGHEVAPLEMRLSHIQKFLFDLGGSMDAETEWVGCTLHFSCIAVSHTRLSLGQKDTGWRPTPENEPTTASSTKPKILLWQRGR